VYARSASTITTRPPDGTFTDFVPLGQIGPISGLSWADTMPGGPDTLACTVQVSPDLVQPQALDAGRIVEVWRGGIVQYEGVLDQPTSANGFWQISAKGAGTYGDQYRDIWTTWTDINTSLTQATSRSPGPLRWKLSTYSNTNLYLVDQQQSGTETITDRLNLATKPGYYSWHIGRRNLLSIFPVPTTVTRVLFASSPAARSLAGYYNALYVLYQSAADNTDTGTPAVNSLTAATNTASINKHGRDELLWDITGAGTLSGATALAWAQAAITRYNAASFSGPIPVNPGQYTTTTGVPVDLGCEHAGEVAQLVLADGPYGSEVSAFPPVTFPVGKFEYDEDTGSGNVYPFNVLPNDLGALLNSMAIWLPKPAVTG
jgi:hypothetical protein